MKNHKGMATLELIFVVIVLGVLVIMISGFREHLSNHEADMIKQEILYSNIDTELTNIYSSEWDYQDKIIETRAGDIYVITNDKGKSEYGTEILEVTFQFDNFEKTYEVERSEYYEQ